MKIESIKNYLDNNDSLESIANEIYSMTIEIKNTYPNYKDWFFSRQLKESSTNTRDILFVRNNNEMIACSCLKKDDNERKLCTLYVKDEYRNQGIGTKLIEESFKFLETKRPFITMPEDKLKLFSSIIKKYNWQLTDIVDSIYDKKIKEFCFNGITK